MISKELIEFWQRNNTPIGLMVQKGRSHGVKRQQVERAAQLVYEEAQEIVENVPEIKPWTNGAEYARVILFRNQLKRNMLGWRVYMVAKSVLAATYDSELSKSKNKIEKLEERLVKRTLWHRIKLIDWRIPSWQ